MKNIFISTIDCENRWYFLVESCVFISVMVFIWYVTIYLNPGSQVPGIERIMLFITVYLMESWILYETTQSILSAFNILIINGNAVSYIDPRRGYSKFEYKEVILSKNKNRKIDGISVLYIQPVIMNWKKGSRKYIFIGKHPSFDGKDFILRNDQIIMRESSVFVSALKESFECVEAEPVIMDADEIKNYFV